MFETTSDILNLSLAVGFALIVFFLCITLYHAIFVLRDISQTTNIIRKTAKRIDSAVVQPAKMMSFLFSKARDIAEIIESQVEKRGRKKRKN